MRKQLHCINELQLSDHNTEDLINIIINNFRKQIEAEEVGHLRRKITQTSIALGVKACLAASKVTHCTEKVVRAVGCSDMDTQLVFQNIKRCEG